MKLNYKMDSSELFFATYSTFPLNDARNGCFTFD